MTKKCLVTGKGVMSGNNNCYSKKKTRRRFVPNLQSVAIYSEILAAPVTLRLSSTGLRTIEKNGGLDLYLLNTQPSKLSEECRELRDRVIAAKAKKGL